MSLDHPAPKDRSPRGPRGNGGHRAKARPRGWSSWHKPIVGVIGGVVIIMGSLQVLFREIPAFRDDFCHGLAWLCSTPEQTSIRTSTTEPTPTRPSKQAGTPEPSSTTPKYQLTPEQAFQTGWKYYEDHNYAAALSFFRQAAAADSPHTEAVATIAYMYDNGYGVEQDHMEALKWWKKAAMLGDGAAVRELCDRYQKGFFEIPPDKGEAAHWCVEAAVRGK